MIHITKVFPNTHIFVYKNKQFPFNLDVFRFTSKFFSNKAEDFRHSKYVQLLSHEEESSIEISDKSINTFINYVQREDISIDEDNVLSLNYLGHKYQIDELIESTKIYITDHQSNLVLEILSKEVNHNDNIIKDMSTYEDIVAEHFLDYINDSRMLNLPIYTIYRIFRKYKEKKNQQKDDQNQHKNNEEENDRIFDFLIKCLDKYGRSSSVLFGEIEADEAKSKYLNVLLNKYSKSFDFHFLNSKLIRMKYEQENEDLLNFEKIAKDQNEIIVDLKKEIQQLKKDQNDQAKIIGDLKEKNDSYEKIFEKQGKIINDLKEKNDSYEKIFEKQGKIISDLKEKNDSYEKIFEKQGKINNDLKEKNDSYEKIFEKQGKIISDLKEKNDSYEKIFKKQAEINNDFEEQKKEIIKIKDEQGKQKNVVESNKTQIENMNNETIKNIVDEIENLKKEIQNQKEDLKQFKEEEENRIIKTIPYDNNPSNRFNGILTKLGKGNAMNALSNQIVNITTSSIYSSADHIQPRNVLNYGDDKQVFHSEDKPNSWLCINFKDHRVNSSHYSLKTTNYGDKDNHIPRDWDIEGSNDNTHWDHLDSRRNEESIHNIATANTFEITDTANKPNYYKYLRIIQKGENTSNNNIFFFSSIEFFGKIKK